MPLARQYVVNAFAEAGAARAFDTESSLEGVFGSALGFTHAVPGGLWSH